MHFCARIPNMKRCGGGGWVEILFSICNQEVGRNFTSEANGEREAAGLFRTPSCPGVCIHACEHAV